MKILICVLFAGFGAAGFAGSGQNDLPSEEAYVQVRNGQLWLKGERQRYWAAIGKLYEVPDIKEADPPEIRAEKVEQARRGTLRIIDHLEYRGFNAVRYWNAFPETEYTVGDGSAADMSGFFLNEISRRGWKVWLASLNRVGDVRPEDVDIVDDPGTAEAWREAVASAKGGKMAIRNNVARIWDPRIEALGIERMRQVADHRNAHSGLRWADDPLFVVWELANEEWWMRKMVGGNWQKLPDFFRNQLIDRWNRFLKEKYGTTASLAEAWDGLEPGEDLERETVLLMPMAGESDPGLSLNDASAVAAEALQNVRQSYNRRDFSDARGADVLEFFLGLQLAHKQRSEAALRTWGKSCALSPVIYDTGIGYEIQSQYLHQQADAVAHDAYVNGEGRLVPRPMTHENPTPLQVSQYELEVHRRAANDGRWNNWLLKPPGIAQGVPWLEHNRVEGKPYLCYETQIQQPAKYRADFPVRLGMLASIQDWDFVCWHYFGPVPGAGTLDRPFEAKLDVTTGGHPQGYHYTYDEVQNAMMRAMGLIWRQNLLKKAPEPTTFIYGRNALYDPASMDYAGSYGEMGMDMMQTTYEHGVRIFIDPTREDNEVIGPVVPFTAYSTHNPYRPTDEVEIDWQEGWMKLDAPGAAVFAGRMSPVGDELRFRNGVRLREVEIVNPEGLFDPVGEDRYLSFAVYAEDGKPLSGSDAVSLSLVSTSFNTGFMTKDAAPGGRTVAGTLPVLVARVGGTLEADWLKGKQFTLLDWHGAVISEGVLTEARLKIPSDQPVFVIELKTRP
jgi:hypothetical protein